MAPLFALVLSGCATSSGYGEKVSMAPLPRSAQKAGTVITLPNRSLTPTDTPEVLTSVRLSELRNARGVNTCKAAYNKALKLYGKGQ